MIQRGSFKHHQCIENKLSNTADLVLTILISRKKTRSQTLSEANLESRYYNNTNFSGLETNIPNSYMNPLLQLYRFTPRLRNVALTHAALYCTKEDCMLCQLGFLVDMLEKANGQNCQASNFLNTLRCVPAGMELLPLPEGTI